MSLAKSSSKPHPPPCGEGQGGGGGRLRGVLKRTIDLQSRRNPGPLFLPPLPWRTPGPIASFHPSGGIHRPRLYGRGSSVGGAGRVGAPAGLPPPCGEGTRVGVSHRLRVWAHPHPQSLPTRGREAYPPPQKTYPLSPHPIHTPPIPAAPGGLQSDQQRQGMPGVRERRFSCMGPWDAVRIRGSTIKPAGRVPRGQVLKIPAPRGEVRLVF